MKLVVSGLLGVLSLYSTVFIGSVMFFVRCTRKQEIKT
jgi:hypothetical protein